MNLHLILYTCYFQPLESELKLCPAPSKIEPCNCSNHKGRETLHFNCDHKFWVETSEILDSFLADVGPEGLGCLSLAGNRLNKLPDILMDQTQFYKLDCIQLQFNNIRTLSAGSFNFKANLNYLNLEGNQLAAIEPGAFQGNYGNNSRISLRRNNLTRYEMDVFQRVLELMDPFNSSFIDLSGSKYSIEVQIINLTEIVKLIYADLIDCDSDPCHLTWLLRDNRHFLNRVHNAKCSDGVSFEEINHKINKFEICQVMKNNFTIVLYQTRLKIVFSAFK